MQQMCIVYALVKRTKNNALDKLCQLNSLHNNCPEWPRMSPRDFPRDVHNSCILVHATLIRLFRGVCDWSSRADIDDILHLHPREEC